MLDLKKLESLLDERLNSETKESLEQWLLEQKRKDEESGIFESDDLSVLNSNFAVCPAECPKDMSYGASADYGTAINMSFAASYNVDESGNSYPNAA